MDATILPSMVSSLNLLFQVVSLFTVLQSDPCFLCRYPYFLRQNHLLLIFHVLYCAQCASGLGGGWGGIPWVAWRHSCPHTCFYAGMRFNLPNRFQIPDPSPAPFPTGDWGVELRGSYMSRTSQLRF